MREHLNITFASRPQRPLDLDLYLPEVIAHPKLVINIHGGAWRSGDKSPTWSSSLTDHGLAVASIQYRLSTEAKFPAQLIDCREAIRWLRLHADGLGLDADRIGVTGHSAGGHLGALLGLIGNDNPLELVEQHDEISCQVAAVAGFYGPTDFVDLAHFRDNSITYGHPKAPESELIGGPVLEHVDRARAASPTLYVHADAPPFLLIHGDNDRVVPDAQSRLLHEKLVTAGVRSELLIVPGGRHGGPVFHTEAIVGKVAAFFHEHLEPRR